MHACALHLQKTIYGLLGTKMNMNCLFVGEHFKSECFNMLFTYNKVYVHREALFKKGRI